MDLGAIQQNLLVLLIMKTQTKEVICSRSPKVFSNLSFHYLISASATLPPFLPLSIHLNKDLEASGQQVKGSYPYSSDYALSKKLLTHHFFTKSNKILAMSVSFIQILFLFTMCSHGKARVGGGQIRNLNQRFALDSPKQLKGLVKNVSRDAPNRIG